MSATLGILSLASFFIALFYRQKVLPKKCSFTKETSPPEGDLMSGPAGLEERPADGRTLSTKSFAAFAVTSIARIESRRDLAGRSSNEVLIKQSALQTKCSSLQDIPAQILIIFDIF
jgi:hypothetical protein